jgi:hypothetical protein
MIQIASLPTDLVEQPGPMTMSEPSIQSMSLLDKEKSYSI